MANPDKVLSFLDLAGDWDPSLALVMLGAIAVGVIAFTFIKGRSQSLLGEPLRLPSKTTLDSRLITGSLGFGVGWGLAGFCPGPALVALGAGEAKAAVFVAAMLAGMGLFELIERRKTATEKPAPHPN
ncbi:MAG: transporter [Gammaproteobacteria bacterium]|nr:transporter [Gammaproteobacteria bacterium]